MADNTRRRHHLKRKLVGCPVSVARRGPHNSQETFQREKVVGLLQVAQHTLAWMKFS